MQWEGMESRMSSRMQSQMDRWMNEQLFEEDVRAMLQFIRPHRRERLLGWNEMRSGGAQFRVTVSWDPQAERENIDGELSVPKMTDILESILVGSVRNPDELDARQEFAIYRKVVHELLERIDQMQACYE